MWKKIRFLYIYKKEMENEFQKSITERGINVCTKVKFEKKEISHSRRSIFDKYLLNLNFSKIKIIHIWTKQEQSKEWNV